MSTSLIRAIVILLIAELCRSNELSRCCGGGSRHFKQTSTCSNIRSEGSSATCVRAASICCLRTLLDESCDDGSQVAQVDETCPISINLLGGGLKKECCECCLLAKDMIKRNEPCIAPTGFSAACLRSFNKCCTSGSFELTHAGDIITGRPYDSTLMHLGDRCETAQCEHLCHDRGGDTVECSCRDGYDLAPDGHSCVGWRNGVNRRPSQPFRTGMENCVNRYGQRINCNFAEKEGEEEDSSSGIGTMISHTMNGGRNDAATWQREDNNGPKRLPQGTKESGIGRAAQNEMLAVKPIARSMAIGCVKGWNLVNGRCIDVDECNLGSHDCGALYQCRNTQGSYRCDPKKCGEGELQNPITGECISVQCPLGYYPKNGMCNDVDECAQEDRCSPSEECVNTPGSYRCQQKGNLCASGYEVNKATGFCDDIDECKTQSPCGIMMCINTPGSYKCRCNAGYEFNDITKKCEDVDECKKFAGHVCDLSAECINTIGSFECSCKAGYQLAADGRKCDDVNECLNGMAKCEQKCVNIPGSYQCICERGFSLSADGMTCEDINECSVWAGSGNELCMGGCVNTKGSYLCQCPPGYKIQPDGRTCIDIDECTLGECKGGERICVNTLGSFKCHQIDCPENYVHDYNNKNRCNRDQNACEGLSPSVCIARFPLYITWQFISLARNVPISTHRPSITLFKVTAPSHEDVQVQFELKQKSAITGYPSVIPAVRANFLLQKGEKRNSAVVTLRDSLDGPQTVTLELILRMSKNEQATNSYLATLVIDVSSHKRHTQFHLPNY